MAALYSDQITIARALAAGSGYSLNNGILESGGTERIEFFSFLTTGAAQNDTVALVKLPKGARILGGEIVSEALGASVTLALGTDVDLTTGTADATTISAGAANLLAATSHATAAKTAFAATFLLGAGAKCNAGHTTITATIGGATPTTAKQVVGWVRYLQN